MTEPNPAGPAPGDAAGSLQGTLYRYDDPFAPLFPDAPETVRIDAAQIRDFDTFHHVFAEAMGFPAFYGRNMNAWIDCLSDLRSDSRMSRFRLSSGQVLLIELVGAEDLRRRVPDVFAALMECAAAVNLHFRAEGTGPALAIVPV